KGECKMRCAMIVPICSILIAATFLSESANAQMTIPQLRMYEAMRGVDGLQRTLDGAVDAMRRGESKEPVEQSHSQQQIAQPLFDEKPLNKIFMVSGRKELANCLGLMFEYGLKGFPEDIARAAVWYQKGADAGDARAMTNLGILYYNGRGVTQD